MGVSIGAFVPHGKFAIAGSDNGVLAGRTFAAKDIIDVAGHVTGCGNPDWLDTHEPASVTAPTIQRCLDAGAEFCGKTITEELATGLTGENTHYGSPYNCNAPGRVAGGSSSGSAAAVAAGLVDFSLGSDTGGSVRSPASFCGIYGIRPSHGRIPMAGVMPLAATLDVVGWFARDPNLLAAVGQVLLEGAQRDQTYGDFVVAADAFEKLDRFTKDALLGAVAKVEEFLGSATSVQVAGEDAPGHGLDSWALVARTLWGAESWAEHRDWIETVQPKFGTGVAARFALRAQVRAEEAVQAGKLREAISSYLDIMLDDGAILALPAAPGIAPLFGGSDSDIDPFRAANEPLGAIAGLGRLSQIVLPMAEVNGAPLGLGLAARNGNDEILLELAVSLRDAGLVANVEIPE